MRATAQSLKVAIQAGNVDQVIRIIQERDAAGNPVVNINALGGDFPSEENAFLYTLNKAFFHIITSEQTFRILDALLSTRDRNNNPIIDLNVDENTQGAALERILRIYERGCEAILYYGDYGAHLITPAHIHQIVERMINCRDNRGNRILNIGACGYGSPLLYAIGSGDPAIVRLLLDLRNADGSYAIDVNHVPVMGRAPLDVALTGFSRIDFQPNTDIVTMLRQRGALTLREIPPEQLARQQEIDQQEYERGLHQAIAQELAQFPAAQLVANLPDDVVTPADRFNQNPQNTHLPEIERTVDLSIAQLKKRYANKTKPSFDAVQKEIEKLITRVKTENTRIFSKEQIANIEKGFEFIIRSSTNTIHAPSKLYLRDIIVLIWMGIHDKTQLPAELPVNDDNINICIAAREQALLDKFLAIATTYPNQSVTTSCLGGTRNLIVSTLDKAHPDVLIAPTTEAIQELAIEQIKRVMLDQLLVLSLEKQRSILKTWDDDPLSENPAATFRNSVKDEVRAHITQYLGTILPQAWLYTVFEAKNDENQTLYDYSPKPIVHAKLFELIEKINNMPNACNEVKFLKDMTARVFNDNQDRAFEHEYRLILNAYNEKIPTIQLALEEYNRQAIEREFQRSLLSEVQKLNRQEIAHESEKTLHVLYKLSEKTPEINKLIVDLNKYVQNRLEKNELQNKGGLVLLETLQSIRDGQFDFQKIKTSLDEITNKLQTNSEPDFFKATLRSELKGYYVRAQKLFEFILENKWSFRFLVWV